MRAHQQISEDLVQYALGELTSPESGEVREHLDTCPSCRRELEDIHTGMAALAISTAASAPPARSRARLLKAVAAEPRSQAVVMRRPWWNFMPAFAAVLLAIISMLLWREVRNYRFLLRQEHAQVVQLQKELEKSSSELAEAKGVKDLLHAPDAWPLTLVGVKTPPQPQMKVIYSRKEGSLLWTANNTPVLPEDKIYELWLLPMDGSAPMPAGWIKPDSNGHGAVYHRMKESGISAKGFAVTIEPAGGSDTPTMPIKFSPAG